MKKFYEWMVMLNAVSVLGTAGSVENGQISVGSACVRLLILSVMTLAALWEIYRREEACANERKKSNNCWKQNCPKARS